MRAVTEPRDFFPSQDAIQILSTRYSTKPVLPLLRALSWLFVPSAHLQSSVPLLVSPHLAHIRLHFRDNSPEHCLPILQTLTKAAGSLKSVELTPEFNTEEMQNAVSALLLSCKPNLLREFCVASPISEEALLHVAQIPGLRRFSLRSGTPALTNPLPLTMFPSLRTLLISVSGLPTWLEILRHIQSKRLTQLSVEFSGGDNNTLPVMWTHLQHSGIHRTLTEFSVCPGAGWISDRVSIAPILDLRELISLTIYTNCKRDGCIFCLSDNDIERLVKAMPKLEILSLGTPCAEQMHDNLTVKSLVAISKHCKALKVLEMHINCQSIVMSMRELDTHGYFPAVAPSSRDVCPLRLATFGPCPIPMGSEGGSIVGMVLLQLFPRLYEVRWNPLEVIPPWSSVNTLIRDHTLVRLNLAKFGECLYAHPAAFGLPYHSQSGPRHRIIHHGFFLRI